MADVIHFYSARGPHGAFSNFSGHRVFYEDHSWPTSEHAFQAMKFPQAPEHQRKIRLARSPGEAKRLGLTRKVRIRPDWDTHRVEVMRQVLRAKFTQHDHLRQMLLDTGDAELVEHTANDAFWGDGGDGHGRNMLGRLLMELRDALRA